MKVRDEENLLASNPIQECAWEALQKRPSCIAMDYGMLLGVSNHRLDARGGGTQELIAQALR